MLIKVLTEGYYRLETWPDTFHLTPHFMLKELANNSGDNSLPKYVISKYSLKFNEVLEYFRVVEYKKAITVNSAFRQEAYNAKVNGDKHSAHLIACAIDFNEDGKKNGDIIAQMWKRSCEHYGIVGAINIYNGYIHLECFSDVCYGNKNFKIRDKRTK